MRAGRPVFYVPPEAERLKLDNILIAWKDTREARRAIWDALPLLQKAAEVNVVEIIEDEATSAAVKTRVDDVVAWLGGHNITAHGSAPAAVEDASAQIETIAGTIGADLIVAGAYGHTRFSEWVFGGVTRDLLTKSTHCSVLSH
jgi:nucleotide-binding universal stress UspA family protein